MAMKKTSFGVLMNIFWCDLVKRLFHENVIKREFFFLIFFMGSGIKAFSSSPIGWV